MKIVFCELGRCIYFCYLGKEKFYAFRFFLHFKGIEQAFLVNTLRFPRRPKIWSDLTNYMIFICIICFVLAMRRQRFTVWRKLLLRELMMMKPF